MRGIIINDLVQAVGGRLVGGMEDLRITGVTADTRALKPGEVFFALVGENTDGHNYVMQALEKGAAAAVVSREVNICGGLVYVQDTLKALGDFAAWYRKRLPVRVVGVTGSVGKTTAKEMIAAVLSRRFEVLKNEGNFNNEIGVPLTIFQLADNHQVLVQEMAMRLPGEIAYLARICMPDIGVITNIGLSHIERLGSQDAIAAAKAELLENLTPDGAAVLNADDPYYEFLAEKTSEEIVSYGVKNGDVRGEDITIDESGRAAFNIIVGNTKERVSLPVVGRHNVYNALAAAAVGLCFGLPLSEIAAGIENAPQIDKRAKVFVSNGGWTVYDDTYNAAPASVHSALETLALMKCGRRIAVLGDMLELGEYAEAAHKEIGRAAAQSGLSLLVTVGSIADNIAAGASEKNDSLEIRRFASSDEAAEVIRGMVQPDDVVLVKGSRAMRMEKIVEALR